MTATNSVTSSVEVATDPHTAFSVFTEELDCWWIQGPINFFDAARAYSVRIEPGVGGRIIEVYDGDTGEGLEVARITVWDPPARLAWLEKDGPDVVRVTYELEPVWTAARVIQRHEAPIGAARALRRMTVARAVARRLRSLKEVLERT